MKRVITFVLAFGFLVSMVSCDDKTLVIDNNNTVTSNSVPVEKTQSSIYTDTIIPTDTLINKKSYVVKFIGDRFDNGLAGVMLESGQTCIIDETGNPIVLINETEYNRIVGNDVDSLNVFENGYFCVDKLSNDENYRIYSFFNPQGINTMTIENILGTNGYNFDLNYKNGSVVLLREDADFYSSSVTGILMDVNGNILVEQLDSYAVYFYRDEFAIIGCQSGWCVYDMQGNLIMTLSDESEAMSYASTLTPKTEETALEKGIESVFVNSNVSDDYSKINDNLFCYIDYGKDGFPYYALFDEKGNIEKQLTKIDADFAGYIETKILVGKKLDENNVQDSKINLVEYQIIDPLTEQLMDVPYISFIDSTSGWLGHPLAFSKTAELIGNDNIPLTTNFLLDDGTFLLPENESGQTIIYIDDTVPRY